MLNSIDLDQFVYTTSNSFTYVFIIGEAKNTPRSFATY